MLFTLIINLLVWIIGGMLNLLPNSTGLNSGIQSGLTTFIGYANSFNFIFPVDTLFQVFISALVIVGVVLAYDFTMLIIGFIRGGGKH